MELNLFEAYVTYFLNALYGRLVKDICRNQLIGIQSISSLSLSLLSFVPEEDFDSNGERGVDAARLVNFG